MFINKVKISIRIFLLCFICILFNQCNHNEIIDKSRESFAPFNNKKASIVDLIANPKSYDKKIVQVKGFIHIEVESSAVYISESDYNYGITKNSLWIEMSKEEMNKFNKNNQYVIIEGSFDMKNKGHENDYSGSLSDINKLDVITSLK